MTESNRRFLNDLAISLTLMSLILGGVYLYGNNTYSAIDYLDGMGDFVTGPLYPGIFLYYPPFGVAILLGALRFSARIKRRSTRLPLIFCLVLMWMWLGLLTSVEYYGYVPANEPVSNQYFQ